MEEWPSDRTEIVLIGNLTSIESWEDIWHSVKIVR